MRNSIRDVVGQRVISPSKPKPQRLDSSEEVDMNALSQLTIRIFADEADRRSMAELNANPLIRGFTTNPTLMHKVGVTNFEYFARDILQTITEKPISFEVLADDSSEMRRQALKISKWGANVYVKIPVVNTRNESSIPLIRELGAHGVKLNITAMLLPSQVEQVIDVLNNDVPAVLSVFAGRIADTGVDPIPVMCECKRLLAARPQVELLWASVREILNIFQANDCQCDIVTVPSEILARAMVVVGMNLSQLSLETIRKFAADAIAAGYVL